MAPQKPTHMRLLVLCEHSDHVGGLETYLAGVLPALAGAGWEIRVVTRSQTGWADEHAAGSAQAAQQVREIASEFAPDVITLHSVMDALVIEASRESPAVLVYHLHDHRLFCPNGDRVYPQGGGRCRIRMGNACMAHALVHGCAYGPRPATIGLLRLRTHLRDASLRSDRFIVFSEFMASLAAKNGVREAAIATIDPPLADDFFNAPQQPRSARKSVLFSGRIQRTKGLRSLIGALGRLPEAERPLLTIAGAGPDLQPALAAARERGIDVRALGMLDRNGVIAAIDAATIVAMPSLWEEAFGLAGIEAFARSRPVVAYAGGAIDEWIGEGGIAVKVGDEVALARAIATLMQDRRHAAASAAAKTIASRYRLATHIDELARVLRAWLSARRVSASIWVGPRSRLPRSMQTIPNCCAAACPRPRAITRAP